MTLSFEPLMNASTSLRISIFCVISHTEEWCEAENSNSQLLQLARAQPIIKCTECDKNTLQNIVNDGQLCSINDFFFTDFVKENVLMFFAFYLPWNKIITRVFFPEQCWWPFMTLKVEIPGLYTRKTCIRRRYLFQISQFYELWVCLVTF